LHLKISSALYAFLEVRILGMIEGPALELSQRLEVHSLFDLALAKWLFGVDGLAFHHGQQVESDLVVGVSGSQLAYFSILWLISSLAISIQSLSPDTSPMRIGPDWHPSSSNT
jgi:hypothetical protein